MTLPPDDHKTIAHIMPWSGMGGVEIATVRLVALTFTQFRHVAFCLPDANELQAAFRERGIEVFLYTPPTPSLWHALRFFRESRTLAKLLRAANVDLVHCSETKAALHVSLAVRLAGLPLLCHVRVSQPSLSLRERLPLMLVNRFIFVSEEASKTFAIALPASRRTTLYDAVEIPTFDLEAARHAVRLELDIPPKAPVVGMIARVSPQKDYFTLADAAVPVLERFPSTRFLIIGDNALVPLNREHFTAVRARLQELGIFTSFLFTGHRQNVPWLVCAADFCILPTHREGFPLSILEAMALGKAVIATAVGGIPEIVQPGVNGLLHAHKDSRQLAEMVEQLLADPAKARTLGSTAQAIVQRDFSVESYRQNITKIYTEIL